MKKFTHVLLLLAPTLFVSNAYAETASIRAHVTRTLVSSTSYGGCMALIDKVIASQASRPLNCPSQWVSFSCDGTFNTQAMAFRKLDIAQKSEVTGHKVELYIDDSKKHNGYCFAYRIDSFNAE